MRQNSTSTPGRAPSPLENRSSIDGVPRRRNGAHSSNHASAADAATAGSAARSSAVTWRRPHHFQQNAGSRAEAQLLQCLAHFVAIKTVSGDPELHEECFRGAKFLGNLLESIGMQARSHVQSMLVEPAAWALASTLAAVLCFDEGVLDMLVVHLESCPCSVERFRTFQSTSFAQRSRWRMSALQMIWTLAGQAGGGDDNHLSILTKTLVFLLAGQAGAGRRHVTPVRAGAPGGAAGPAHGGLLRPLRRAARTGAGALPHLTTVLSHRWADVRVVRWTMRLLPKVRIAHMIGSLALVCTSSIDCTCTKFKAQSSTTHLPHALPFSAVILIRQLAQQRSY